MLGHDKVWNERDDCLSSFVLRRSPVRSWLREQDHATDGEVLLQERAAVPRFMQSVGSRHLLLVYHLLSCLLWRHPGRMHGDTDPTGQSGYMDAREPWPTSRRVRKPRARIMVIERASDRACPGDLAAPQSAENPREVEK